MRLKWFQKKKKLHAHCSPKCNIDQIAETYNTKFYKLMKRNLQQLKGNVVVFLFYWFLSQINFRVIQKYVHKSITIYKYTTAQKHKNTQSKRRCMYEPLFIPFSLLQSIHFLVISFSLLLSCL